MEAQTAALKDIARDLADTAAPEAAYLNEFETVMRDWVKRSLKKNERLVVFIDDLDRCMPDVALQVLEALKLYLNIERLMFVVGVDKTVVDQLVVERYKRMGVDETKALDYLAKMFQVEIPLAPTEWEVEVFFADIVAKNETWKNLEHRQDALEPVIMNLAKRSPREVKRLGIICVSAQAYLQASAFTRRYSSMNLSACPATMDKMRFGGFLRDAEIAVNLHESALNRGPYGIEEGREQPAPREAMGGSAEMADGMARLVEGHFRDDVAIGHGLGPQDCPTSLG